MRDDLRNYVLEMLGSEDAVLIVDKTGFVKKGEHSVGVKRQHSGTAGRIENCQVGVFLAYASEKGTAFIDRELFLPEEWAHEQKQRKGAGVPAERKFLSKPQLAQRMLKRAFTAGVKATWVMADTVCSSWRLRTFLEEHQQPYVLAVPSNFMVRFIDKGGVQQPHIKTLFKKLEPEAWQHFSAGSGSKGERLYDWAWLSLRELSTSHPALAPLIEPDFDRWFLARRSLVDAEEIAYYLVFAPTHTQLAEVVKGSFALGCLRRQSVRDRLFGYPARLMKEAIQAVSWLGSDAAYHQRPHHRHVRREHLMPSTHQIPRKDRQSSVWHRGESFASASYMRPGHKSV